MKNTNTKKTMAGYAMSALLKTVLTAVAIMAILFGGSFIVLMLASNNVNLSLAYAACYLLPALLLPAIWLRRKMKYMLVWLLIAALCLGAVGVNLVMNKRDESLRIETSAEVEVQAYLPFREDSKVVKAESKTLKISENLPQLDGEESLFPLYSSIVSAVYPYTLTPFGEGLHCNEEEGYEYLANKETDIFFGMNASEGEAPAAINGTVFEYTGIGSDALVFFVHKDNPVETLTAGQIRGIYSGEITNWEAVGGKNEAIMAYQNEPGTGVQNTMERFMGEVALMEAPTEQAYGYLYEVIEEVSVYRNKTNSIGFTFRHCVEGNPEVKMIAIEGAAPTRENIRNGSYPVIVPVFAATRESNANENVGTLIEWILSAEGQAIVEANGYVSIA